MPLRIQIEDERGKLVSEVGGQVVEQVGDIVLKLLDVYCVMLSCQAEPDSSSPCPLALLSPVMTNW
jgi:hypothetical protein